MKPGSNAMDTNARGGWIANKGRRQTTEKRHRPHCSTSMTKHWPDQQGRAASNDAKERPTPQPWAWGGIRGRTTSPRTSEKRRGTRRKAPTKDKKQHPARRHSCTSRHLGRKTAPACESEMTSEQNKYENNRKHRRTPHEEAGTNAQAWLTNRQDAHK